MYYFYITTPNSADAYPVQADTLTEAQLALTKATGVAVSDQSPLFGGQGFSNPF